MYVDDDSAEQRGSAQKKEPCFGSGDIQAWRTRALAPFFALSSISQRAFGFLACNLMTVTCLVSVCNTRNDSLCV